MKCGEEMTNIQRWKVKKKFEILLGRLFVFQVINVFRYRKSTSVAFTVRYCAFLFFDVIFVETPTVR